jgi:hypothetical protein
MVLGRGPAKMAVSLFQQSLIGKTLSPAFEGPRVPEEGEHKEAWDNNIAHSLSCQCPAVNLV